MLYAVDGRKAGGLLFWGEQVDHAVDCDAGHYVDKETRSVRLIDIEVKLDAKEHAGAGAGTNLVTLSREWKTSEFLHIAIAIALFPKARQKVLMKRRLLFGKTHILRMRRKLTK